MRCCEAAERVQHRAQALHVGAGLGIYLVWCGYEGGAAGDSGRSGAVGLGVCGTSRGYFKPCLLPRAAVSSFLCFESYVRVRPRTSVV